MSEVWREALAYVANNEAPRAIGVRGLSQLLRWGWDQDIFSSQPTINFHPDRIARDNTTVISSMRAQGMIENQFQTTLTSGYRIAEKNAIRMRRESEIFGGVYDSAESRERPKYGALNMLSNPRGGWPRFGSCHWILSSSVLERCTATIGDSVSSRAWFGTYSQLQELMTSANVVEEAPTRHNGSHRFALIDGPIELQIHGDIVIERDAVGLKLDPSFKGSRIEEIAHLMASEYGISLDWCPMLRAAPHELKVVAARAYATRLIGHAVDMREFVTAEWIGRSLSKRPNMDCIVESNVSTAAAKYLWNRLLLVQKRGAQTAPHVIAHQSNSS
ncbi:DUF3626 domain-containing protein [Mycolicibacterium fluoranthenivorans]|uniref:DUF3626 domain-containing protein n=1 Tax=Mycolicibacterium fluoranthenivorans TaxID=258505 RepID=A0A7G8PDZ5_9MYCO|nr:DUF3626 domain-containing protein [Mycolicibacterium fluoranthenivorans]QNJ92561.1 DUF3626 domain-containing protein [Mycolicibacterium fluoranthenivorans]